jgi:SAM-dependent methyltransferase
VNYIKIIKSSKIYYSRSVNKLTNIYRAFYFSGRAVHCSICSWNGSMFFDDKCPKCNSVPRTRLVPFSLQHFKLITKELNVLHIAPNVNEYNYIRNNFYDLKCYDRLDIKQRKHTNIRQNIINTDLISETYDLAIAWHVFEHIVQDIEAVKEIYRLLKPKGQLLVSVPIYPIENAITFEDEKIDYKDYLKFHGHYDHCRSCGLDYYKRFEKVGFKTQTLSVSTIVSDDIARFGLQKDHVVWCFSK